MGIKWAQKLSTVFPRLEPAGYTMLTILTYLYSRESSNRGNTILQLCQVQCANPYLSTEIFIKNQPQRDFFKSTSLLALTSLNVHNLIILTSSEAIF